MGNHLSNSWTSAEQLAWRQKWTPGLSALSLVFSVLALVIFHVFPRLREFPRSVFSWVAYYNILWDAYIIWKWHPDSALADAWSIHLKPGSSACTGGIFLDNFTMNGFISCNTLITLTVFLMVIMNIEMRNKPMWYWGYVGFVWGFPLIISFPAAFAFQQTQHVESAPCGIQGEKNNWGLRLPGLILLGIQVLLLGSSLIHMRKIYNSVDSTSSDFPMKYLVVRFTALYIAQLFNVLPTQIYWVLTERVGNSAIYSRFFFTTHALGGAVDSIVMMVGNPDFMDWSKQLYINLRIRFSVVYRKFRVKFAKCFPEKQGISHEDNASSTLRTSVSIEMHASPAVIIEAGPADTDQEKLVASITQSTDSLPYQDL